MELKDSRHNAHSNDDDIDGQVRNVKGLEPALKQRHFVTVPLCVVVEIFMFSHKTFALLHSTHWHKRNLDDAVETFRIQFVVEGEKNTLSQQKQKVSVRRTWDSNPEPSAPKADALSIEPARRRKLGCRQRHVESVLYHEHLSCSISFRPFCIGI